MVDADSVGIRPDVDATKRELRTRALARRAALPPEALHAAEAGLCRVALEQAVPARPATVALYASMPGEPGTEALRVALRDAGHRVLLPLLRTDLDLEWALDTGELRCGPRGTGEPVGPSLGLHAIAEAEVVLVPGLLVSWTGTRLGRGGGSYDRALARRSPTALVAVLCLPEEIVQAVPAEPHDARVDAALTPAGLVRLGSR